jgi:oxygen-independent coproporphyrinogen-3 oxidase
MVIELLPKGATHCQLHLGGGTPTHIPPDMLAELLDYLIERIPGDENVDRSIEVDPRVTTDSHLKLLIDRRFKRISMGLQDLDPARSHGFTGVNIDLIYGLPLQTRKTWADTMKGVLQFDPDRLACFGYAHLPTKIKHQRAINEGDLPPSRERLGMLLDANRFFADNGFEAVGMDHFAKPDDELAQAKNNGRLWRNFMGYTDIAGLELLGLGCSAISEFKDLFVQNLFPPEPYEEKISSGKLPIVKGCKLDRDDVIRKAFINHLMCNLETDRSRRRRLPDNPPGTIISQKYRHAFRQVFIRRIGGHIFKNHLGGISYYEGDTSGKYGRPLEYRGDKGIPEIDFFRSRHFAFARFFEKSAGRVYFRKKDSEGRGEI